MASKIRLTPRRTKVGPGTSGWQTTAKICETLQTMNQRSGAVGTILTGLRRPYVFGCGSGADILKLP